MVVEVQSLWPQNARFSITDTQKAQNITVYWVKRTATSVVHFREVKNK